MSALVMGSVMLLIKKTSWEFGRLRELPVSEVPGWLWGLPQ